MKIKFNGRYKAVTPFELDNIPELMIITGRNGVGKTQLLHLLSQQYYGQEKDKLEIYPEVQNKILLRSHFSLSKIEPISLMKLQDILLSSTKPQNTYSQNHIDKLRNKFGIKNRFNHSDKDIDINNLLNKFSFQDFFNNYITDINEPNFGLEVLFFIYYYQYTFKKLEFLDKQISIDEEKITKELGPAPWIVVNEFLEMINSPYKINNPIDELKNNIMGQYNPAFIDYTRGIRLTSLSDLSSGENIMVSLAFWLYAARNQNIFPDLILLDEPDAHLHPEFIKQFLNILEQICSKYKAHIIMTTHSPITVAVAPQGAIYEMQKYDNPRIIASKSTLNAIHMLCSGLLVFQSDKKYVITEDETDSKTYNSIYKILNSKKLINNNDTNLVFIPISNWSKKISGGKDKVKEFVEKIQFINKDNGIIVKGLLDSDNTSNKFDSSHIKYIKRYSIENYLLDPINIFASVLKDYSIPEISISIGEEANINLLTSRQLQIIADNICNKISPFLPDNIKKDTHSKNIHYINSVEISCPSWIFDTNGHELMKYCQQAFSNGHKLIYYDNLINTLKRTTMVSSEFIDLFNELLNEQINIVNT